MLQGSLGKAPTTTEVLKDAIQDSNINFLLGSGLSCPFLPTLGNIEALLTAVDTEGTDPKVRSIIRTSLYKTYFDNVIAPNLNILVPNTSSQPVLDQYKRLLSTLNSILLKRKVTLLSKEVNIFTTNIDIFLDKALEDQGLEYNDGFNGRFTPTFSLSNFRPSRFKRSLFYDKSAEVPVFNLVKLHGSVSWRFAPGQVLFSNELHNVRAVGAKALTPDHLVPVAATATLADLVAAAASKKTDAASEAFLKAYEDLIIVVNPTKDKFKHTLLNETYYELLRMYSNELEKENTILFALGFSFADEHIRDITLRAANSNPTLTILVFAHTSETVAQYKANFGPNSIKNNNVRLIIPNQEDDGHGGLRDKFPFDFANINERM